jgi:uncharacterized protein (TIGR03435 family)
MYKILAVPFALASALTGQVIMGQPAPKLSVVDVVQGRFDPASTGKPRLLEFWATWCGPCVENIPHLNQLADQFSGRDIDFIAITSEERPVVEKFLQSHRIRGTIVLDRDSATSKAYRASLPSTALIDRAGRLVRLVHPEQVTAAVLEDLMADRPVQVPATLPGRSLPMMGAPVGFGEEIRRADTPSPQGWVSTLVKVAIAPSKWPADKWGGVQSGGPYVDSNDESVDNHMKAEGAELIWLLYYAYDLPASRIEISKYLQGGKYAVEAWVPPDHSRLLKPMLREALEAAVNYRARIEERTVDVLVLTGLPGRLRKEVGYSFGPCKFECGMATGSQNCQSQSMRTFRGVVETGANKEVIIDNPPKGRFTWDVRWDWHKPGEFQKVLREQLGLELRPEKRRLPFLIVEPASAAPTAASSAER